MSPWVWHALGIELKKAFSYRANFWIDFLGTLLSQLGIAFFLWTALFHATGAEKIGGYTFHQMMFYYFFVAVLDSMIRGQSFGNMLREIYDGSLNRYLLYPISFYGFKYLAHAAQFAIGTGKLFLGLGLFVLVFGLPEGNTFSTKTVLLGLVVALFASYMAFALSSCIELISFWADNVWSLLVLLRFIVQFFGGAFLPLTVFPESFQPLLNALPFSYMITFPVRTFMGLTSGMQIATGILLLAFWSAFFTLLYGVIWRQGTLRYTGVGI